MNKKILYSTVLAIFALSFLATPVFASIMPAQVEIQVFHHCPNGSPVQGTGGGGGCNKYDVGYTVTLSWTNPGYPPAQNSAITNQQGIVWIGVNVEPTTIVYYSICSGFVCQNGQLGTVYNGEYFSFTI